MEVRLIYSPMFADRADAAITGGNILRGITSGFVATVVLSPLMIAKKMTGLMTDELDIIAIVTQILGGSTPIVGWVAHFAIGTFAWGGLFALLEPHLPGGRDWVRGTICGAAAWLLMMTIVMPAGGAGFFGLRLGLIAPVMTLVMHAIFGAVLGAVYAIERPRRAYRIEGPGHAGRGLISRPQRTYR